MSDDRNGQTSGKRTLVEEGTAITGNLTSSCPIVVMGRIDGEISGPSMEVAESGVVSGRIKVAALRSRGEVAGELEAESVQLSGRVRDETVIRARSLQVAGTPVKFGECELCIGEEPDKQKAIDEATGAARKGQSQALPGLTEPAAAAPAATPERKRRNTGGVKVPLDVADSGNVAR
jgi:cytoskeletal protein CcmA (bactofilin family)